MEITLVRRDQFNITPQGIVHKPTAAAFMPYPGDPYSGITRAGQLSNKHPNGINFSAEDVQRMMRELWGRICNRQPNTVQNCRAGLWRSPNYLSVKNVKKDFLSDRWLTSSR
jgi:hypothetical protein